MSDPISVAVLSGSPSDAEFVKVCCDALADFGIDYEDRVISAHRQPRQLETFVREAEDRGVKVFVAMAGLAAHLPGVVASLTTRPVLGVPLKGGAMDGLDALLSVVQMPKGVPVACLALGSAGARNAAILAAQILSVGDAELEGRVRSFKDSLAEGRR